MRSYVSRTLAAALMPLLLGALPVIRADALTLPKGTDVPLVFDQAVSSKTAKVGDRVKFHVSKDVSYDGRTVLREGTPVIGVISRVEQRKRFGVNAKLAITLNPVKSASGQMISLEPKSKGKYTGSRTDQAAYASGGGALLLGPVGLVGGYFVVGKPVQAHVGDPLVSQVSKDTTLHVR